MFVYETKNSKTSARKNAINGGGMYGWGWRGEWNYIYINHTRGKSLLYIYKSIQSYSTILPESVAIYIYIETILYAPSYPIYTLPPNSDADIKKIHYYTTVARCRVGIHRYNIYMNSETEKESENDGSLTSKWGRGSTGNGRRNTSTRKE